MNIVPLNRDYGSAAGIGENDGFSEHAVISGDQVEIVTGGRNKMDPDGGAILFSGTLADLEKNADFPGAAAIIKAAQAKPLPPVTGTASPSNGSGAEFKNLKGDPYGSDN